MHVRIEHGRLRRCNPHERRQRSDNQARQSHRSNSADPDDKAQLSSACRNELPEAVMAMRSIETAEDAMKTPPIVSPQEWEAAREQLLIKEKALTRARDALAADRRR